MQQAHIPSGHHHQRRGSSALRLGTAASAVAALAALHSPAWAVDYTWRDSTRPMGARSKAIR